VDNAYRNVQVAIDYEDIKNKNWDVILSLADLHKIGRFLIALRIAFGLTQKELSILLDVTEAQISKDERNEYHGVSFDKAVKIMDIFGVKFNKPNVQKNLSKNDLKKGVRLALPS
jgi:transcriptional regulator with XRE-family HTH domain